MQGLNKVLLIGFAGRDAERPGERVVTFSVATDESYKDKEGQKVEQTEWHNIVCFGKVAEIAERFVTKGAKIFVEGKIKTDEYTTKEGDKRKVTKIVAERIQMLDRKADSDDKERKPKESKKPTSDEYFADIPF